MTNLTTHSVNDVAEALAMSLNVVIGFERFKAESVDPVSAVVTDTTPVVGTPATQIFVVNGHKGVSLRFCTNGKPRKGRPFPVKTLHDFVDMLAVRLLEETKDATLQILVKAKEERHDAQVKHARDLRRAARATAKLAGNTQEQKATPAPTVTPANLAEINPATVQEATNSVVEQVAQLLVDELEYTPPAPSQTAATAT